MSPIRRYLRITRHSVLEVRIYLDSPSDAPWLLSTTTRDPVLPRIISDIRPKVLPKLREENENAKRKGGKRKKGAIKDVVVGEDFEVVIFLKDLSTRHSLLTKRKVFAERKGRLRGNGKGLAGWLGGSKEEPVRVDEDEGTRGILREEDEDEVVELKDIPDIETGSKRKARAGEDDTLFISSDDEEAVEKDGRRPSKQQKRSRSRQRPPEDGEDAADDKKKLGLNTSYDGFSIYGRTLCLVVKRKGKKAAPSNSLVPLGGGQMMEQWVSTQAAQEAGLDEDDEA